MRTQVEYNIESSQRCCRFYVAGSTPMTSSQFPLSVTIATPLTVKDRHMWRYSQHTGNLTHDGHQVARGYSGRGVGKNNAGMQSQSDVGPIPRGQYRIEPPHRSRHVGPNAMDLTPQPGTNTYGRSDFLIHGDSIAHPGTASKGCIILGPAVRTAIWSSGDHMIEVVQ
jgi:hypothetical protein